jgi:hypothetical protein
MATAEQCEGQQQQEQQQWKSQGRVVEQLQRSKGKLGSKTFD